MASAACPGTIGATMTLDDVSDDGWPPQRVGLTDQRVIKAVYGAYHAVTRRLDVATRQHGLEAPEALVLAVVLREPGCSPGQIRYQLGLHRSTLSSILDRIERDGLIHRAPSAFDGRRFEIKLTAAGTIAAEIAEFVIEDIEAEIATYSSRAERAGARAIFEACVAIGRPGRATER
jgi:DNA-binding MarR family transcriptional regulator